MRALALAALLAAPAAAQAPHGILILAHGGDEFWNRQIAELRAEVDKTVPAEVALGMADSDSIQVAVDRLEKRGVSRIAAVPLFVQSRSEVLDQTRYVLGLAKQPSLVLKNALAAMAAAHGAHAAHGAPAGHDAHAAHAAGGAQPAASAHAHSYKDKKVKLSVPLKLSPALDDDPFTAQVLFERARALSKEPAKETVILAAHGPVDDSALDAWRKSLAALAASVRSSGGFKAAGYGMLRDDAPPAIRAAAVADLRAKVKAASARGRAIVVPVLVSRGGIERKLARDLEGLDYAWDGRALMPHPGFAAWVLRRAGDTQ